MKSRYALWAFAAVAAFAVVAEEPQARAPALVELSITPGREWSHVKWFGPLRLVLTPQLAVWLEDSEGRYLRDLFVTEKSAKSSWGSVRRPEALPVWSHARGRRYADGLFMPTKADPLSDAVSGATPKAGKAGERIDLAFPLPADLPAGPLRLMVEVNSSFDFNTAYPETKGNVNGQPSLVYAIRLIPGGSSGAAAEPVGTGHPAGADGTVRPGTAGLDSALRIVAGMSARFGPD